MKPARNVLGTELQPCSKRPITGFWRDGCCRTGPEDAGSHIICTEVTEEFLEFSMMTGNDLSTPHPEWDFPGLKPGDRWCVCAMRWLQAYEAGVIAPVVLEATHVSMLEFISLAALKEIAAEERPLDDEE